MLREALRCETHRTEDKILARQFATAVVESWTNFFLQSLKRLVLSVF